LHKNVTHMNFSSIQTNLNNIVILQLISRSNNLVTLFIKYLLFEMVEYQLYIKLLFLYFYIITNFIKLNKYHVDMC
jgi:hypothetical protein